MEHVINVLARLTAAPTPENVATTLQVSMPPLADTARYDSLRAQGGEQDDGEYTSAQEVDHDDDA